MPNIEELMDSFVGQTINQKKSGEISTMDLLYAYRQLSLNQETSLHHNFSVVGGKSTGTYRFTGFYGLTTMRAEFQRVMNSIVVVTNVSGIEHISTVEKI